ncbi:hypothetical protein JCM19237_6596 [Photobacterium aphoticum]|uniref:Uncharacterized protein n=1 Tax=Photobacterium aphoticum TaxID=754436 RepID=A0A090R7U4_9GAMM|nr:hypothetical protein JCM19237_6596 [Photobacterium aphoticum]
MLKLQQIIQDFICHATFAISFLLIPGRNGDKSSVSVTGDDSVSVLGMQSGK